MTTAISIPITLSPTLLSTVGLKDSRPATVPAALDSKVVTQIAEARANHGNETVPRLREPRGQLAAAVQLGAISQLEGELTLAPLTDPEIAAAVGELLSQELDHQYHKATEKHADGTAPSLGNIMRFAEAMAEKLAAGAGELMQRTSADGGTLPAAAAIATLAERLAGEAALALPAAMEGTQMEDSPERYGIPFAVDKAFAIFVLLIEAYCTAMACEKNASAIAHIAAHELTRMAGERNVAGAKDQMIASAVGAAFTAGITVGAMKQMYKGVKLNRDSFAGNVKPQFAKSAQIAKSDTAGLRAATKQSPSTSAAQKARNDEIVNANDMRNDPATYQAAHSENQVQANWHMAKGQAIQGMAMPLNTFINSAGAVAEAEDRALAQILQQGASTEADHAAQRTDEARNDKQSMQKALETLENERRMAQDVINQMTRA
ncbi:hypothetical protein [Stenotrophomonas sp. B1-1]|uniref:hypothetical protein n=1 Tax=Stenotrophomonas sp. B1-1 TaxID=2710648 RepID=UPI0013DB8BC8|nr:hypothetical protein [Stenotrophomonas sp. B1-1]